MSPNLFPSHVAQQAQSCLSPSQTRPLIAGPQAAKAVITALSPSIRLSLNNQSAVWLCFPATEISPSARRDILWCIFLCIHSGRLLLGSHFIISTEAGGSSSSSSSSDVVIPWWDFGLKCTRCHVFCWTALENELAFIITAVNRWYRWYSRWSLVPRGRFFKNPWYKILFSSKLKWHQSGFYSPGLYPFHRNAQVLPHIHLYLHTLRAAAGNSLMTLIFSIIFFLIFLVLFLSLRRSVCSFSLSC